MVLDESVIIVAQVQLLAERRPDVHVGAVREERDNYVARRASLEVSRAGRVITTLSPELRYYPVRAMQTTEAALYSTPLRDIYAVIGESSYGTKGEQAALGVRLYVTPAQQFVWLGFILAAAGGFIACLASLYRRRDA